MKLFLVVLIICLVYGCSSSPMQMEEPCMADAVKIIDYDAKGKTLYEESRLIEPSVTCDSIDIHFFKRYHPSLRSLPDSLVNKRYKSETIEIANDPGKERSNQSYWTYTYTYDSLSRLTSFAYSGCMACSNMAYYYNLEYNDKAQLTGIFLIDRREGFNIVYSSTGDIKQVDHFQGKDIVQSVVIESL